MSVLKALATSDTTKFVVGPVSSINGDIAIFNGTTGKIISDSGVLISHVAKIGDNVSEFANDAGYITSAGAPVQSVSNSDSTLTISPNSGAVVASLNLANANTWSALQTFGNDISFGGKTLNVSGLATGDNLQYNGTNWVNQPSGYSQIRFGSVTQILNGVGGQVTIAIVFSSAFTGTGTPKVVGLVVDDGSHLAGYQYNIPCYARSETNSGFTILLNYNLSNLGSTNTYTINYIAIK